MYMYVLLIQIMLYILAHIAAARPRGLDSKKCLSGPYVLKQWMIKGSLECHVLRG